MNKILEKNIFKFTVTDFDFNLSLKNENQKSMKMNFEIVMYAFQQMRDIFLSL